MREGHAVRLRVNTPSSSSRQSTPTRPSSRFLRVPPKERSRHGVTSQRPRTHVTAPAADTCASYATPPAAGKPPGSLQQTQRLKTSREGTFKPSGSYEAGELRLFLAATRASGDRE